MVDAEKLHSARTNSDESYLSSETSVRNDRRYPKWRKGTLIAAGLAFITFVVNISLLFYDISHKHRAVYSGSCAKVRKISLWLHLLLNVCSSLLLGGSNYVMQILSAPTRTELIKAHKNGKWMRIGVQSLHNLVMKRKSNAALWFLLMISSLPLHLMYYHYHPNTLSYCLLIKSLDITLLYPAV